MDKIFRFNQEFFQRVNDEVATSPLFSWIETYESIIKEILNYYRSKEDFQKNTKNIITQPIPENLREKIKHPLYDILEQQMFFGTAKRPEYFLELIQRIPHKNVTDPEYYRFLFTSRPEISFCYYLKNKFPNTQFSTVKKLFDTYLKRYKLLGLKEYFGISFAISAAITTQIPKGIIESLGINHEIFSIVIYCITLFLVVLLGTLAFVKWVIFTRKYKKPREFTSQILSLLEIFDSIHSKSMT